MKLLRISTKTFRPPPVARSRLARHDDLQICRFSFRLFVLILDRPLRPPED